MTMVKTMSGAELKTRLGGLGLPPSWFADRLNVTMRTVVRWFDSPSVAPEVIDELEALSSTAVDEMRRMLKRVKEIDNEIILSTYRTDEEYLTEQPDLPKGCAPWPASWHRQLTFRVMEHLQAQGHTVVVRYK